MNANAYYYLTQPVNVNALRDFVQQAAAGFVFVIDWSRSRSSSEL